MDYEVERKPESQPSLMEMTEAAIKMLENGKNGYFLLVEGLWKHDRFPFYI
jgi:alkaline phosphatase